MMRNVVKYERNGCWIPAHIFNLRSAGLLNVHVVGETVSTYSLRVERVQQIEQGLFDYLGMPPSLLSNSVNEME
ncbi:hypothetical protein ABES58_07690 [Paenibacillus lautus]|uniref:hypothetical protein n=1 Tax=Paenibacillus lautus TaxID=1401 RepID=UPI003D29BF9E